jgi:hypothetical protein
MSDRDQKPPLTTVEDVLQRVAALPISVWRYRDEPAEVRHLGPMAQDLHAALGLGARDDLICVVDGIGVALASIQALHARLEDLSEHVHAPCACGPVDPSVVTRRGQWPGHRSVKLGFGLAAGLITLGLLAKQSRWRAPIR